MFSVKRGRKGNGKSIETWETDQLKNGLSAAETQESSPLRAGRMPTKAKGGSERIKNHRD